MNSRKLVRFVASWQSIFDQLVGAPKSGSRENRPEQAKMWLKRIESDKSKFGRSVTLCQLADNDQLFETEPVDSSATDVTRLQKLLIEMADEYVFARDIVVEHNL